MEQKKYKSKFIVALEFYALCASLGLSFAVFEDYFNGASFSEILRSIMVAVIICLCMLPPIVWLLVHYYAVYLSAKGIKSYTFFGIYKEISWDNIGEITSINFLGVKYIEIRPKSGGMSIVVPTQLKKPQEFIEDLESCGGDKAIFSPYF